MYKSLFAITLLASGSALKFDKDVMRAHGIVSYKQLRADVLASADTRRLNREDDAMPTWICADDDCGDDGAVLCPTGYSALSTCFTEDTDCDNDDDGFDNNNDDDRDDDDDIQSGFISCDSSFTSKPYGTRSGLRNCATQSNIPSGCGYLTEYNDYMECAMEGFVLMLFDVTCDFSSTCDGITYSATEEPITTSAASRGSSAVGALALGAMALVSWFF